ncbi:multidrug resistance protein MATE family protein [Dioscorea alata]|uniref:Multidrug resistance protein MATE family protein n=1 Tax=Dioscorea alata TaxID=55571 RepID=A0ACB7VHQ6_DIOAL|nr:multidrug resistance protein MATE family protein [Dioscorea alata]
MQSMATKGWSESKKTWHIAGPAILTGVFQFSLSFVTVAFVGHIGEVELAAVSVVQNVIEGFAFGVLLGMGSALETLCGQAVGAGQLNMLGIYMQRSWVITFVTALILTPFYVFTSPILKLLRQSENISVMAGKYATWVIPQLFAYAMNFPLQKFYQAQSKVWVMTVIAGVVLAIHALLNWIFVTKLDYGLVGAAIVGNISWWLINLAQMVYLMSGFFPESWTGFSWLAFTSLTGFIKLSLASAVMLCLELWYYTAVIILVGCLKNPEVALSAISICMNYQLWTLMIALGFTVAVSVRVSNELGAGHPKAAKFAVIVSVATSAFLGLIFMAVALIARKQLPKFFSDQPDVIRETSKLGYLLGVTMLINSIQPVLSGVAIGAGWQSLVAFINTGCYYLLGLPIGAVLGFKLKLNAMGIWLGMLAGSILQTVILLCITFKTQWQKEAIQAEERIRTWGGAIEPRSST